MAISGLADTRFGTPGSYEIHQCVHCGLEQTNPLPSFSELKKLYEAHYNFGGERDSLYARLRERFVFSFLYRLWMRVDGDVSFHQRRGSGQLIDIGCNEGRGLRIYAHNGYQAAGLEVNETAAAVAREAGFTVHTSLLNEFDPPSAYDVAVLANVLEHSLDPRQMLLDVHRILARDGEVWISCPNSRSWLREVFGAHWINWHVPFHVSHFSAETLRNLLHETGFAIEEIRAVSPAVWTAQSLIAKLFAKEGRPTHEIRNPILILILLVFVRFGLFPALWLGNRCGRGDCLLVTAKKR